MKRKQKDGAPGGRAKGLVMAQAKQVSLPLWRWVVYVGMGAAVFATVLVQISQGHGNSYASLAAIKDTGALGDLAIAGVFAGLIMALLKIFLDPVFLGIAQRKSASDIAEELVVSVATVAAGVAAEGLLTAAVGSAGSGDDAPSNGITSGGGGNFGGGGASGTF